MADEASNFDDEFYRKLLLAETKKLENVAPDRIEFVPKPGFVMKLRNSKEEKVFINICTSEKVPAAKEVSEEELAEALQSLDPTQYRVPMSLGEPHVELDNRGEGRVLSLCIDSFVNFLFVCLLMLFFFVFLQKQNQFSQILYNHSNSLSLGICKWECCFCRPTVMLSQVTSLN